MSESERQVWWPVPTRLADSHGLLHEFAAFEAILPGDSTSVRRLPARLPEDMQASELIARQSAGTCRR